MSPSPTRIIRGDGMAITVPGEPGCSKFGLRPRRARSESIIYDAGLPHPPPPPPHGIPPCLSSG